MNSPDVAAPGERFNFAQHLLAANAERANKAAFKAAFVTVLPLARELRLTRVGPGQRGRDEAASQCQPARRRP